MSDVVVVGAGVVGASVAWHLARRGVKVTLVDRGSGRPDGSSSRATGGFRAQYGTAINIRLNPAINDRQVIGGTFCPTDGFIRPQGILKGYLEGARALGVEFRWDTRILGAERSGEGITGLVTDRGTI